MLLCDAKTPNGTPKPMAIMAAIIASSNDAGSTVFNSSATLCCDVTDTPKLPLNLCLYRRKIAKLDCRLVDNLAQFESLGWR